MFKIGKKEMSYTLYYFVSWVWSLLQNRIRALHFHWSSFGLKSLTVNSQDWPMWSTDTSNCSMQASSPGWEMPSWGWGIRKLKMTHCAVRKDYAKREIDLLRQKSCSVGCVWCAWDTEKRGTHALLPLIFPEWETQTLSRDNLGQRVCLHR